MPQDDDIAEGVKCLNCGKLYGEHYDDQCPTQDSSYEPVLAISCRLPEARHLSPTLIAKLETWMKENKEFYYYEEPFDLAVDCCSDNGLLVVEHDYAVPVYAIQLAEELLKEA